MQYDWSKSTVFTPYPGATFRHKGQDWRVLAVEPGPSAEDKHEPGKVLQVENKKLLVKCWAGTIWITKHELLDIPLTGDYLK